MEPKLVNFPLNKVHDANNCYCDQTIQHLKSNETRYYIHGKFSILMKMTQNYSNCETCVETIKSCLYEKTRTRLIEWIISLQFHYGNEQECLEMAIRIFDYVYFSVNSCVIDDNQVQHVTMCKCGTIHSNFLTVEKLHLIALTSYFISCKYWERWPPYLEKLIKLTDNEFTKEQILKTESDILKMLQFNLKIPLVTQFLDFYFVHETQFSFSQMTIISYFLVDLTLVDVRFLNRLASILASAVCLFTKIILCSFTNDLVKLNSVIDANMSEINNYFDILLDLWDVLNHALTHKDSFIIQKNKYSNEKNFYLYPFMEHIGLNKFKAYFNKVLELIEHNKTIDKLAKIDI